MLINNQATAVALGTFAAHFLIFPISASALFLSLPLSYFLRINARLRSNWQAKSNFGYIHTGIRLLLISSLMAGKKLPGK